MTGLIGAVRGNVNMNVLILDNGTVAMTGTQQTMATGDDMYNVIRGLGVPEEHIKVIVPVKSKYEENLATLRGEIEYKGLSVIIARRACVQAVRKVPKKAVNS
jgi:indolepyruvate ferredoxin oxidoreductase alpha subunit